MASGTTTMANDTILKVEHLSMRFGGLMAINDLSFEAYRGDITALIGPNGAGKTTLVRLLLGEITPDAGTVTHSKTLQVTYQDQTRESLKATDTMWEALAPMGGDSINVQGHQRHGTGESAHPARQRRSHRRKSPAA